MENKKRTPKIVYTEPEDYFPKELRKKYKLGEYADPPHLEKIKAVMLGHAVGDALGVPVEFCRRSVLDEFPVAEMAGYGAYPVPAGSWSDDTSMSLATLDGLANETLNYSIIMDNISNWYHTGEYTPTGVTFDVGGTCRAAILKYNKMVHWEREGGFYDPNRFFDPLVNSGMRDEYSNGNGSLMRIHPFVLYAHVTNMPLEEWMLMIQRGSALTHSHFRSMAGCLIYAFVLMHLLADPTKSAARNGLARAECHLRRYPDFSHYSRIFSDYFADLPRAAIKSSGYVVDTLEASLWCLLTTDSYRDCVLKAVNLGEDTDTVAAVAGGLAGALYGYDAIPVEWLETLKKRDYVEDLCERAAKQWESVRV